MRKILVLFAHPAFQKSRVNAVLIEGLDRIEGVTFHDLYQAYPELDIDIKYEQKLLEENDVIIFHHPFFWYSTPAILKEWQDLVLTHGWAYGREGNALKDKLFFNTITTGGPRDAYRSGGYNAFTMRQLLAPIERTAILCKMKFLPPFVVHGTHAITGEERQNYRESYHSLLEYIRDNRIDLNKAAVLGYLNEYFD